MSFLLQSRCNSRNSIFYIVGFPLEDRRQPFAIIWRGDLDFATALDALIETLTTKEIVNMCICKSVQQ